jgi:hypothetical protein
MKTLTPSGCKYQIVPTTPLVFVDACEDLVMVDDVVTPSNLPIVLVEEEELEETLLDVNVSQRLCNEEPFERTVHTRVDRSTWDCQLSPNPHALMIYFKKIPVRGTMPERFEKCHC